MKNISVFSLHKNQVLKSMNLCFLGLCLIGSSIANANGRGYSGPDSKNIETIPMSLEKPINDSEFAEVIFTCTSNIDNNRSLINQIGSFFYGTQYLKNLIDFGDKHDFFSTGNRSFGLHFFEREIRNAAFSEDNKATKKQKLSETNSLILTLGLNFDYSSEMFNMTVPLPKHESAELNNFIYVSLSKYSEGNVPRVNLITKMPVVFKYDKVINTIYGEYGEVASRSIFYKNIKIIKKAKELRFKNFDTGVDLKDVALPIDEYISCLRSELQKVFH